MNIITHMYYLKIKRERTRKIKENYSDTDEDNKYKYYFNPSLPLIGKLGFLYIIQI